MQNVCACVHTHTCACNAKEKILPGRPRDKWKDSTEVVLKDVQCEVVDCISLRMGSNCMSSEHANETLGAVNIGNL